MIRDVELLKDFFNKQEFYIKDKYFTSNRLRVFGNGTAFAEGKNWSKRRKIVGQVFHHQFYKDFIPTIKNIVKMEVDKIK